MPDAEDKYHEPIVIDRADKAVISNAVFPEIAEGAPKSFTDFVRIIESRDSFVKELRDTPSDRSIQPVEFSLRARIELNRPLWD
jgi:hypothetical protein